MQALKSESFRFQRNSSRNSSGSSTRSNGQEHCRIRLKDVFDNCENKHSKASKSDKTDIDDLDCPRDRSEDRTVFSVLNLNDTRRYIRNGADRISKTFSSMRVTFGTLSQRFKTATKRRQILEEGPMTPNAQTPYTKSRQVLGRTPEKLYSPFSIDSPYTPTTTIDKENVPVSMSLIKH